MRPRKPQGQPAKAAPVDDRPPLTIAAFGRASGLSEITVRRMITRGELRAYRVGPKLIRIPASELDRVMVPIIPAAQAG